MAHGERQASKRLWGRGLALTAVLWAVLTAAGLGGGCASARQVQFFEVVYEDPETGDTQTNYYRMTVRAGSLSPWSPAAYRLKAAYLSAETVDVLEGKGPFVPEADLPREADATYRKVLAEFRRALADRAAAAATAAATGSTGDHDAEAALIEVARQAWMASLSDADVVAIGRTGSDDPYAFRKLVFYATARNVDLEENVAPQIESIIGKVQALARREQQRAAARRRQRAEMQKLAGAVLSDSSAGRALFDALLARSVDGDDELSAPNDERPAASKDASRREVEP